MLNFKSILSQFFIFSQQFSYILQKTCYNGANKKEKESI